RVPSRSPRSNTPAGVMGTAFRASASSGSIRSCVSLMFMSFVSLVSGCSAAPRMGDGSSVPVPPRRLDVTEGRGGTASERASACGGRRDVEVVALAEVVEEAGLDGLPVQEVLGERVRGRVVGRGVGTEEAEV